MMSRAPLPTLVVLSWVLTLAACGTKPDGGDAMAPLDEGARAAHAAEIEQWRQDYVANLTRDEGWLSLAGLFWLEEGENGCGADPAAVVTLPEDRAPVDLGTFRRAGRDVRFTPAEGVAVLADGTLLEGPHALVSDAEGTPTRLEHDSLVWYVIERGDRVGVRVKDREHPDLAAFRGIETYAPDSTWRVPGRFVAHGAPKVIPVPNVLGATSDIESPGYVELRRGDDVIRLDALPGGEDELWLIFGDATNRTTTYGGGRFLYTPVPDADGRVVVDFNKAYNPPCAYTPFATCPLPWPENRVAAAIEAGEKRYPDGDHHG